MKEYALETFIEERHGAVGIAAAFWTPCGDGATRLAIDPQLFSTQRIIYSIENLPRCMRPRKRMLKWL